MPFVDSSVQSTSLNGNDIIDEVLRLLLSGQREEMNKLSGNVGAGSTTLTFKYEMGGIRAGALVDIDLETYRVWEVDTQNKTATVEPGYTSTDTSPHSDGSLVYVNPRMSRASIFKAINDEIVSLAAEGLYTMDSYEFTFTGARQEYDFPAQSPQGVYDVRMSVPGPENRWRSVQVWKWQPSSDKTTFPSGQSLYVPMGLPGRTMQVLYKRGFTRLLSPDDDVAQASNVPPEMQDIIAPGALLRLGMVREIKRNFTEAQGDTRRATEVPPNAVAQSFNGARQFRSQRIDDERARLMMKWPLTR